MAKQTEKMVHVAFPYRENAPDTLYYGVNDRDFYIDSKTAMTEGVDVPECLYEVIKNSNAQIIAAAEFSKALQETAIEM